MTGLHFIKEYLFLSYQFIRNTYGVPDNTIETWTRRNVGKRIKLANGQTAIAYDTIPQRTKEKYQFASKSDLLLLCESNSNVIEKEIQRIADHLQLNILEKWQSFTSLYRGDFDEQHTVDYAKLHCLLVEVCNLKATKVNLKSLFNAVKILNNSPLVMKNYSRFTKKISESQEAISKEELHKHIPHGHHTKKNRLILDELHQAVIIEFYKDPKKLSIKECHTHYQNIVKLEYALEPASYSSVKRFIKNYAKNICAEDRHGTKYYKEKVRPFAKRSNVKYSFTLCGADGLQLGRSIIFSDGTQGQATIWIYFDWKSEAIIGYSISKTETFETIRLGLLDVLKKQQGKCPKELVIDKKWCLSKEVKKLLEDKAGIRLKEKLPYNPKENKAERLIQEFNRIHRTVDSGWASMTNRSADKVHNPEHIRQTKPISFAELQTMVSDIVNIYNCDPLPKLKGKCRMEVCLENICPEPKIFSELDQVRLFGDNRIETIRNGCFKIQINSKKYEFEVFNYDLHFDKLNNCKVRVYYDLTDMQTVEAFFMKDELNESEDTYLGTCQNLKRFNPSKIEQTPEDLEIISHQMRIANKVDARKNKELQKHAEKLIEYDANDLITLADQTRYKAARSSEFAKLYKAVDADTAKQPVEAVAPRRNAKKASLKPIANEEVEIKIDMYKSI